MGIKYNIKNAYTIWYLLTLRKSFNADPPRKIKADQNRRIHRLMKRAYKIPVYREKFEQSGTTPADYHSAEDLVKFPTLTKPELRKWMESEWNGHPEKQKNLIILTTSGSSGNPLKMIYTQKEQGCSDANWVRVLSYAGYKPLRGKLYSFVASHRAGRPHNRDSVIQELGLMRRKIVEDDHYAVGDGLAVMIDEINEYKPDAMCLRRNVMVRMAQYAEEHHLKIHRPKLYAPAGETIDRLTRAILTKAFGEGLIDAYGCNEMGSFIYEFPGKPYRVVANDIAVANVYNDNDELSDEGRIIATSLYKQTYPLINYETLDLGKSFVKDGIRYFTDITGRANDLVKHENGADSSAIDLMLLANSISGISQFRFIEETYHDLLVELVADPFDRSRSRAEIEEEMVSELGKLFGDEFRIRIEWLDELPPEENGKLRCFVCKVG